MRWFKHDADMSLDLKVQEVIHRHRYAGYSIWCFCLELVAREGFKGRILKGLNWTRSLKIMAAEENVKVINDVLKTLAELNLIDRKSFSKGDLYIPKMEKRVDEYTRKKLKKLSGQTPDNIRTISGQYPRKTRQDIDKTRQEETQETISSLKDLSKQNPDIKASLTKMGIAV